MRLTPSALRCFFGPQWFQAHLGWSFVSSQSFCSPRSLYVRNSPLLSSVISTYSATDIGSFHGILWNPFPFSRLPSVRPFIASHFTTICIFALRSAFLSFCSNMVKLFSLSGPMTGFYLYFAITKREFSLGSWRERLIEVRLIMLAKP